ncbi:MAG: erythronate-4-phosphate dehydrogenase, partial [Gammaproteobacteria bacterium]|nr:erythronate-4-phosphate dehydrogenase [Gammaproteobacteria bacterium]
MQNTKLSIVADELIPLSASQLADIAIIKRLPGHAITQQDLIHADALLTRTITSVNAKLLNNTPVKFVGSATAGIDHLDTDWLAQQKIHYAFAAGANAEAVSEYVLACLATLMELKFLSAGKFSVGIIGVGHVGSCLAKLLAQLNIDTVLYDPPRALHDKQFISADLSAV